MNLSEWNHLRSNPMIRFKEETVDGVEYIIVAYMIADSGLWQVPGALETRGNVYQKDTGECVCACFPKFFNVGETPETSIDHIKESIKECYDKRDGSMVAPILTQPGDVVFKTKKSFYSDVAKLANSIKTNRLESFCREYLIHGYTPIFEFTHPEYRIVLDYEANDNFTLLAVRNQKTGEFLAYENIKKMANYFKIKTITRYEMDWDDITKSIKNDAMKEGYVLLLNDNTRVKYKTDWYISMHYVMTDLRERDIAKAFFSGALDDIMSLVSSQGKSLEPIFRIEHDIISKLRTIAQEVDSQVNGLENMDYKSAACSIKGHPYFHLIMQALRYGDYGAALHKHFKDRHLSDYSLKCVYNTNFGSN